MKVSFVLGLLLPPVALGGTFTDDVGQTITWTPDKPKIVCGAMDAIALFHFGIEPSQIIGTFGERSASGSNINGIYADGNENAQELGDHTNTPYDPAIFPADPNDAERAFLDSIQLDLSPSCSASNFYCDEVNIQLLDQNGWPEVIIFGSFYGFLLSDDFRAAASAQGVGIIQLTDVYNPIQATDIPRSMIAMIQRMEDLAKAVGVEGVDVQVEPDKDRGDRLHSRCENSSRQGRPCHGWILPLPPNHSKSRNRSIYVVSRT